MHQHNISSVWAPWIGSGLFFGLAFVLPYGLIVSAIAIFLFVHAYLSSTSARQIFLGLLLTGTLKASFAISWFWYTYPIEWLGTLLSFVQITIIGVIWSTCSLAIGLGFTLVFLGCRRCIANKNPYSIHLIPLAFVMADILGAFVFSLYSLGPGSVPNSNFSFGHVGYLLADSPIFLPLAQYGGVYALSFFLISAVVCIYQIVYKRGSYFVSGILLGLLSILLVWAHIQNNRAEFLQHPSSLTQNIITIETKFPSTLFKTDAGYKRKAIEIKSAVTNALMYKPSVILLPEDSRFTETFKSQQDALLYLTQINTDVVVVDSARTLDTNGNTILRAFIYDTKTQTVSMIDKQYLVPQGEFVPYLSGYLIGLIGDTTFTKKLFIDQSYQPGPLKRDTFASEQSPLILFCMESIAPLGLKRLMGDNENKIVYHLVSHSWFHNPSILWFNLERMLKVQAVWNKATIIEASNMKSPVSYVPSGEVHAGTELEKTPYWTLHTFIIDGTISVR